MRTCEMCGTSIEHRNGNTKYCKECAEVRKIERDRIASKRKRENYIPEPKYCKTCGVSLEGRNRNAEYCITCYLERSKQYQKKYLESCSKPRQKDPAIKNQAKTQAKKKSTPSAMDKSNFARKYHSSYGRIENDIQTGRVKLEAEDVELAKELGLM